MDFDGNDFHCDDDTRKNAPYMEDWLRFHQKASQIFGKDINVAKHHKRRLIETGFKNVREEVYRVCLPPYYFKL